VDSDLTPDWRVEETPPGPYIPNWYMEMGRPYRLSPFTKQADRWNKATRLQRASPFPGEAGQAQVMIVVGFQFMWYYKKVPMPWFKYAIKTRQWLDTCPKSEWGHFICLFGRWASLGIDSGAALHRISRREGWMEDGLLGLGAFSMTLRAPIITHYFTPLENHPVLDFLYAAYMGTMKYRYLDNRFYDTKYRAPYPKPWHYIPWLYPYGDNNYYDRPPLWFKK
ncbi:hypothetical protein MSG28_014237, partial [Choristoneura fumiferana]